MHVKRESAQQAAISNRVLHSLHANVHWVRPETWSDRSEQFTRVRPFFIETISTKSQTQTTTWTHTLSQASTDYTTHRASPRN